MSVCHSVIFEDVYVWHVPFGHKDIDTIGTYGRIKEFMDERHEQETLTMTEQWRDGSLGRNSSSAWKPLTL